MITLINLFFSRFSTQDLIPPNVQLSSYVIYKLDQFGKENLLYLASQWKSHYVQNYERETRDVETEEKIKLLTEMARSSPSKPIFPRFRPDNWLTKEQKDHFETAKAITAERVLFRENGETEIDLFKVSHVPLSINSPLVLKERDLEYLKRDFTYLYMYCQVI